jgi:DNA-binding Xre family transcriptional regulator
MDYSYLKETIKTKKKSIKGIAELIEMSEQGLHSAFRNNTLKIKDLESICNVLKVSPCIFFIKENEKLFEERQNSLVAEDIKIYGKKSSKQARAERFNHLNIELES